MILATRNPGKNVGFTKKITDNGTGDIITLSEVKSFMRVTTDDDNTLINTIIEAMIDSAERYTGLSFRTKEMTLEYQEYGTEIILPYGPHVSVDAVRTKYEGEETTLSSDAYWVTGQEFFTLNLTEFFTHQQLEIDITTGYGAGSVPALIKLALLKATLSNYEDRQDLIDGNANLLPNSSKKLLDQYKRVHF